MAKRKIIIPIREDKPSTCVVCGLPLHQKSEYYCSPRCADIYVTPVGHDKPPFLSKWKIRKRKEARDPLIAIRHKTRAKTRDLIRRGRLKRQVCAVCQSANTIPHHEDYADPFSIIWLCAHHHKAYHDGAITLFDGKLRWTSDKLIHSNYQGVVLAKKHGQPK